MLKYLTKGTIAVFLLVLSTQYAWSAEQLMGIGDLPGGLDLSVGYGMSDDGSVVVGWSASSNGNETLVWTPAEGGLGLGGFSGPSGNLFISYATAVSSDGSVVVGISNSTDGHRAFRWSQADGMTGLGSLPGEPERVSKAYDVSADGSVIVGEVTTDDVFETIGKAFRWTEADGMISLGSLPGGARDRSKAFGVSADGRVVVGRSTSTDGFQAFRWTEAGGMVGLGDLPGTVFYSEAYAASADGSVVVGMSLGGRREEAFRWTEATGMVGLGEFSGGNAYSAALATSGDGSVVVGSSQSDIGPEAFRWTEADGMRKISELLIEEGVDITGWVLTNAQEISNDGVLILGNGINPVGNYEAWLVRIYSGLITPAIINNSVASVSPTAESSHGLARESLDTHMQAAKYFRGHPDAKFDLYASGFGGEWHSYTAGGTVGLAVNVSNEVRVGAGVFASRYNDDDLEFSGEYELDAVGGTLWAGYDAGNSGPELHVVGMLADLDNEIKRGYLNGSGLDSSKGDPGGSLTGAMVRAGWEVPITEKGSVTPFASYTWTETKIDGYTETGGGFPAQFDSRKDSASIVKAGLEGQYTLTDNVTAWGQAAYGKRLDDNSDGISGEIIGLMDFALPGYELDDDWVEMDLGLKWQVNSNFSVMASGGSAFDNDQNPKWRANVGMTWSVR